MRAILSVITPSEHNPVHVCAGAFPIFLCGLHQTVCIQVLTFLATRVVNTDCLRMLPPTTNVAFPESGIHRLARLARDPPVSASQMLVLEKDTTTPSFLLRSWRSELRSSE